MSLLPNHKTKFDKKLDEFFGVRLNGLDIGVINTLADSCPSSLLPLLAQSFDVDINGLDETDARYLIKSAFEIHYYSGTFYSLNRALKALYSNTNIKEWHEYGGAAYHFKLEFEASDKGIDFKTLAKSDEIINAYKNVRSVYDGASIALASVARIKAASASLSGESVSVYPLQVENLQIRSKKYCALTFKFDETMEVKLDARIL